MRFRVRPIVAIVVGAALMPTGAGAQTNVAALPPAIAAFVAQVADSAKTIGLPTDPLYAKAAEGVLKHADDARIQDAVRRLLRELSGARAALGPGASEAELVAGASALHAGIPASELSRLRRAVPIGTGPARMVMPLVVLTDLVARRVSLDVAVASIEELVARGVADREFSTLRASVERDIAGGISPDAATRQRSAAVARALPARPHPELN
jgi:hypothetical protein